MKATTATAALPSTRTRPAKRLDERDCCDGADEHARVEEQAHQTVHPAEQFGRNTLLQRGLPARLIERRGGGAEEQQAERREQTADQREDAERDHLDQETQRDAPGADGARRPAQQYQAAGDAARSDRGVEPADVGGLPEDAAPRRRRAPPGAP